MVFFFAIFFGFVAPTPDQTPNRFFNALDGQALLTGWYICEDAGFAHPDQVPEDQWIPLETYLAAPHRGQGVWWLQTRLELDDRLAGNRILSLCPEGLASATEVYWDGHLLSSNGTVGAERTAERVGRFYEPVPIDPALVKPGSHTVAIHISNHHNRHFWNDAQIMFGRYDDLMKGIGIWQVRVYFLVGLLFVTLILNTWLFFHSRHERVYLFVGLVCTILAGRLLLENIWVFDTLDTTYYDVQNAWRQHATFLAGYAVATLLLFHFQMSRWGALALFVLFGSLYAFRPPGDAAAYLGVAGFAMCGRAWALRKSGAIVLAAVLALGIATLLLPIRAGIDPLSWLGSWIVLGFNYALAKRFADKERERQDALLRSARLENQLLKSSIKPHFLMNALTSIVAWMRRDPETAADLVQALADEYRTISEIADRKTIPLAQELELCRSHLQIMSLRKDAVFRLEAPEVPACEDIPPLVLHTLVENGLTHGYEHRREGRFRFELETTARGMRYRLFNDGDVEATRAGSGTGMKYVRARLRESYGENWNLVSGPGQDGWETTFEIYRDPAPAALELGAPSPLTRRS
ncbi:Histidine kinase [Sulfidibacter corallicola]|uniref:Histidine kinase n=1 Tax=Sulfidibacter corallicola TaxID=2818388 RepID=A0A8A4TIP7_SULCO|nr:histidine kinase [Sulfidibacter corallicola]QTD48668.1 histidine kinase [Sulfidibacter corallicola]